MVLIILVYSGSDEILRKRLKSHLRRELIQSDPTAPSDLVAQTTLNPYGLDYICVLDFEATCQEKNPTDFIHEIIEFPVLLLNLQTLCVVRAVYYKAQTSCSVKLIYILCCQHNYCIFVCCFWTLEF